MGSHRVILTSTYCYNMHMKRTKEINNKISTFLILCLEWNLYLGWRTIKQMYSNKVMTWIFIIIIQHYPESKCLSPISAFYICVCVCVRVRMCVFSHFSHDWLFATLRTVARQSPLSLGFSRQEYWSDLPCAPPGDLPCPGIKPESPASSPLQADSLPAESSGKP